MVDNAGPNVISTEHAFQLDVSHRSSMGANVILCSGYFRMASIFVYKIGHQHLAIGVLTCTDNISRNVVQHFGGTTSLATYDPLPIPSGASRIRHCRIVICILKGTDNTF